MSFNEDVFKKHKFLIVCFLLVFCVFIYSYWKNSVGLFFDIPSVFSSALFNLNSNNSNYLLYIPIRARFFNDLLVAIPFNSIFFFIKDNSILYLLKYWSTSYCFIHLVSLIVLYLSGRWSRRFDIAAVGFLFYALFSIPNSIWIIREIHISIPLYFSLLAFFLSKEKFCIRNMLVIIFLSIYMFESFETSFSIGLIFFIFNLLYMNPQNKKEETWTKELIALFGISYAFYIPLRTIYFYVHSSVDISSGLSQWIDSIVISLKNIFSGNLIIVCFGLLMIFFAILYKKEFTLKRMFLIFIPVISVTLFTLYVSTGFIPNPKIELHNYGIVLILIYPVFLLLIILDYLNIDVLQNNKFFFSNLIVIACIFGILNLSWQIHSFYEFGKYEAYLKNLITKSKNVVVYIPQSDFKKYTFLNNNMCFGTMMRGIFLTKKGQKSKIIFPSKYFCDYSKYCYDGNKHTYYDESKNILYLQSTPFKIKTKYWDLSNIVAAFKKQGRVKKL